MHETEPAPVEIHEITFDALDPFTLATFWSQLLDRPIRPGDSAGDDSVLVLERSGQPGLLFMRVPESKTVKNRMHLDLWPTLSVRDTQVERAVYLGAEVVADHRRPDGPGWVVFADPEGNEFCIGSSRAERDARRGRQAKG
ncbi:MAG TPA: VOC family protein [Mycobacteriales bacterium]|nr:VOC family protein [Mycobacteriales bacterium]